MIALWLAVFSAMILLAAAIAASIIYAAGQYKALRAQARHIIRTEDDPRLIAELEALLDEDSSYE